MHSEGSERQNKPSQVKSQKPDWASEGVGYRC